MNLSATAQATLLLTCYFIKASNESAKPLTNVEWGRFALWLKEKNRTPAELLAADPKPLLTGWHDKQINAERILALLGRGHSLALAVEKWQRAGLWMVTRSDPEYPKRLKSRLKTSAPPVLFGCGHKSLLNAGGIAVVGSRNASDADLLFSKQLGAKAAAQSITIVSGGARGVDETAMLGAMQAGGRVIGVMADSLLRAATSAKWRNGLVDGNVVLISPFYPEAGFNAGNAMARNRYIYCLADTSLVVHSGKKGGTLNGAEENLKKQWVPLWVKPTQDKDAANEMLVEKGGRWCEEDIQRLDLASLLTTSLMSDNSGKTDQPDLFSQVDELADLFSIGVQEPSVEIHYVQESDEPKATANTHTDFYQLFVGELSRLAIDPLSRDDLIEKTGLHKSQITDWLKRALDDGYVKKLNRPVLYQYINTRSD
ncbi:Putative DNA processing chain A [hydrothermal vent metagenome]|uniref:DNA processing chain A n=1 Tax=hydrothermal vent metagenome TaxID=652676 RepID=A0A3B1B1U8_9ZZZZ